MEKELEQKKKELAKKYNKKESVIEKLLFISLKYFNYDLEESIKIINEFLEKMNCY